MLSRIVVLSAWALSGPLLLVGCGDGGAPSNPSGTPTGIQAYAPDAGDASPSDEPATALPLPGATAYEGSSLCGASRVTGCYPDDLINACIFAPGNVAKDIDTDAANINIAPACHVVTDGLWPHTVCLPSTIAGMYASSCTSSTECSPGYECVAGGTCRHYCCSGNSSCAYNQFCDVQPVAQSPGTLVPVCMAETPCAFDDDTCAPTDQCSVVRDTGATSCVAVGTAQDGESCKEQHCARGLVCLGALGALGAPGSLGGLGSRLCEPLCNRADPLSCKSTGRTCVGMLPLFQDAKFGVCQ